MSTEDGIRRALLAAGNHLLGVADDFEDIVKKKQGLIDAGLIAEPAPVLAHIASLREQIQLLRTQAAYVHKMRVH